MIIQVLQFLVVFCFATPFFVFSLYGIILIYYQSSKKQNSSFLNVNNTVFEPRVSIVTPTHNEERIITKKIDNLLISTYPKEKLELIFVDDSTDSTPKIIAKYAEKYPFIRLISFTKRMGYSPCMFAGVKASTGDVIVLSDAGSFHDNFTIQNLVKHFANPRIGAVTGNDIILNNNEKIGSSETLYLKIFNFVRSAETKMDSTFYFKGEASAVRKSLISDFEGCRATFDTATALFIRQKGYKTIFDSAANFYEYAPRTREERIRQKTIRAANWIKILLQFKGMAFRVKYGKFGLLTLPANFGMLLITPVAILAGFIFFVFLSILNPIPSLFYWLIPVTALILSFVVSRNLFSTFLDLEVSLLIAIYEIAFTKKRHDQIDTVESTRR